MAVRASAKRVDAYALDKRMFRKDGVFPYDERILSWDLDPRPSGCGGWLAGADADATGLGNGHSGAGRQTFGLDQGDAKPAGAPSWGLLEELGRQRRKSRAVQRD
jgi:hypothetical protein